MTEPYPLVVACPLGWRSDDLRLAFPAWRGGTLTALTLREHAATGGLQWWLGDDRAGDEHWPEDSGDRVIHELRGRLADRNLDLGVNRGEVLLEIVNTTANTSKSAVNMAYQLLLHDRTRPPEHQSPVVRTLLRRELTQEMVERHWPTLDAVTRQGLLTLVRGLWILQHGARSEAERQAILQLHELAGQPGIELGLKPSPPTEAERRAQEAAEQAAQFEAALAPGDRWLSLAEAARVLKTGKPVVKRWIETGTLTAFGDGAGWKLRESDVLAHRDGG